MKNLKTFAGYLRTEHLRNAAEEVTRRAKETNVSLMRIFSSAMSTEELVQLAAERLEILLKAFEEGTALNYTEERMREWETNRIPRIESDDVHPSDLIPLYTAQEQTLLNFLPQYTRNADEAVGIVCELHEYYAVARDKAVQTLFRIKGETEKQLKESQQEIKSIFEGAPDAVVVIDDESRIVHWNPRASILFGWSFEEVKNQHMHDFIIPERYREAHIAGMKRFLCTGKERVMNKTIEIKALNKKGGELDVALSISPTFKNGNYFFIGFIRDITKQKKTERKIAQVTEQLKSTNRELGQYAYIASHDLQEPLRTIISYLQILEKKLEGKLTREDLEFFWFVIDASRRMKKLITDLLSYAKIETGKLDSSPVSCPEVLNEVLQNMRQLIQDHQVKVECHALPLLNKGNKSQLVLLFQNLISNAIKYRSTAAPHVVLSASEDNNCWIFSVQDNGIGIEKEYHVKIFEMFRRLHNQDAYEGTGIGLAASKKITENHGGKIWVESEPGKGSVFYFTISKK